MNHSSSSVNTVSSSNNSGIQKPYFAGSNTHAIYSKYEEEWIGKDSSTSSVDPDLYELLKEFLEDHFSKPIPMECTPKSTIDNLWYTSRNNILQNKNPKEMLMQNEESEERIRVIPGGKYGCSSFVKFCANQKLQNETIGSISQMVQLAIDEDILRYHKTLLVRTTDVDMHKAKAEKIFTLSMQQDFRETEVVPVFQNDAQRQNMIDYKR